MNKYSVMKLYQKSLRNRDFYYLFFYLAGAKGNEFIDLDLPTPNIIIYPNGKNGVFIAYFIEGTFFTEKAKNFLQDISKRFISSFLTLSHIVYVERIKHPPIIDEKSYSLFQMDVIYSLKHFSKILEPLKKMTKKEEKIENLKIAKALGDRKVTDDALFDYMRFIAYDFVKQNGKNALSREYLEQIGEIGNEVLGKTKDFSTIRAKAKAIYEWIIDKYVSKELENVNNWNYVRKTSNNEELKMTRQEHIIKINKQKAQKTKEKVYQAIKSLKEKNEKISIRKVTEKAKVSKSSVEKYLKQAKEEGLV